MVFTSEQFGASSFSFLANRVKTKIVLLIQQKDIHKKKTNIKTERSQFISDNWELVSRGFERLRSGWNYSCKHVIMIGDHKQLRPNPAGKLEIPT